MSTGSSPSPPTTNNQPSKAVHAFSAAVTDTRCNTKPIVSSSLPPTTPTSTIAKPTVSHHNISRVADTNTDDLTAGEQPPRSDSTVARHLAPSTTVTARNATVRSATQATGVSQHPCGDNDAIPQLQLLSSAHISQTPPHSLSSPQSSSNENVRPGLADGIHATRCLDQNIPHSKPTLEQMRNVLAERIKQSEAEAPHRALERSRYIELSSACKKNDVFYVTIHQIFCIWSADKTQIHGILSSDAAVIDGAFGLLSVALKPNYSLSPDHLRWFCSFPFNSNTSIRQLSGYYELLLDIDKFYLHSLGPGA